LFLSSVHPIRASMSILRTALLALAAIASQRASPVPFFRSLRTGDVTERISGQTARDVEHSGIGFQKKNPASVG
jgi:hypothetical protein